MFTKRGDRLYPDRFDTRVRAAIRVGDYKLITGDPGNGSWVAPPHISFYGDLDTSQYDQNLWLFNIRNDPNEHTDLSKVQPEKVKQLLERLSAYNATAVPPRYPPNDPQCDPRKHGGAWVPWM